MTDERGISYRTHFDCTIQMKPYTKETMPYYYTPFRNNYKPQTPDTKKEKACPFCDQDTITAQSLHNSSGKLFENEHYYWMVNWFPRTEAHTMLVPKRHIIDITDETPEEIVARQALLIEAHQALTNSFGETGYEIFLQTGPGSLSSIKHLHWHLIPTTPQKDSLSLAKLGYFWTTEPTEEKVVIQPTEITIAREELIERIRAHN